MGRTARQAVAAARHDVAKTISRSLRALNVGIGKRSEEEIKQAFDMPQKEAPMWTHAALRIGAAHVTSQGKDGDRGLPTGLAVIVVGQAGSVESWEKQAEAFRLPEAPKPLPGVIDVPAEAEAVKK
jgi:hypothetical protein